MGYNFITIIQIQQQSHKNLKRTLSNQVKAEEPRTQVLHLILQHHPVKIITSSRLVSQFIENEGSITEAAFSRNLSGPGNWWAESPGKQF